MFAAEKQVLEDGEGLDQHAVLMDHADTGGDRVFRGAEASRSAMYPNLTGIGRGMPVKQPHQGRFAGTVFADDPMHSAARDREVGPVIRPDRAEALADAVTFDGWRRLLWLSQGSAGWIRPATISVRAVSVFSRIPGVTSALLLSSIA